MGEARAAILNLAVLVGRLTRDPELRSTASGQAVASFTLAVDQPFLDQQGQRGTDFINVVCWRALAATVAAHLGRGALVAVRGRLQVHSYEGRNGQSRWATEIVPATVRLLEPEALRAARTAAGPPTGGDVGAGGGPDAA